MTTLRAILAESRFWFGRPAARYSVLAMAIVGVFGAMIPTGVQGHQTPVGIDGGAWWGFEAAVSAWPLVAAAAVTASISEREASGLGEVALLSGVSRRRQAVAQIVAVWVCTLSAAPWGLLGGALAGLGDSLRQGGPFWGAPRTWLQPSTVFFAGCYLVCIAAAIATVTRRRLASLGGLTLSIVAFLGVVAGTNRDDKWEWAARVFPWAPLWHAIHRTPDLFWLPMSAKAIALVLISWFMAGLLAVVVATRASRSAVRVRPRR